jgi:hypothetical protein
MIAIQEIKPKFVEFMPEFLEDGILYISVPYRTASHRCCCGCATTVVTSITPTSWEFTYDGRSVSLSPSIGSSALACRSHYWIRRNKVRWAHPMTDELIEARRRRERRRRDQFYRDRTPLAAAPTLPADTMPEPSTWWGIRPWLIWASKFLR